MISAPQIDEHFNAIDFLNGTYLGEPKKILICAFNQYPDALGALLEIIDAIHNSENELYVGLWADQLNVADTCNSYSPLLMKVLREKSPQNRTHDVIAKLYPKVRFIDLKKPGSPKRYFELGFRKFHIHEVQKMFPENQGKGYAIGASLIDGTRRSTSSANFNKMLISKLAKSYDQLCEVASEAFVENKIDSVILFNGRRTHDQAIIAICEKLDIQYFNYEVGGSDGCFDIYQHGTHDRYALQQRMVDSFKLNKNDGAVELAHEWFQQRRHRKDDIGAKYASKQKIGTSLEFANPTSTKIGFYSSSTDELASVGAGWESVFGEQEDSISLIANLCSKRSNIELVVRTHPNMRTKSFRTKLRWNKFIKSLPIDRHIDANSQIDSYALMDQLDGVIVHGSTVGIESTYWGKPAISMAPTFYDQLGCVVFPKSAVEISNWLDDLPRPNSQESTLPYGFFVRARGLQYKNYQSDKGTFGTFKSFDIGTRNKYIRKIFEIENRLRRLTW